MKKGLMLTFVAFSVFCLTACDFLNGGKKDGSDSKEKEPADSTVYGTGESEQVLRVGSDIPVGTYVAFFNAPTEATPSEVAGRVGVYERSVDYRNLIWEDDFQTTSLCELKANQVVKLEYATLQNLESNPKIGELKNGAFQIGTQVKANNFTVKCLGTGSGGFSGNVGQAIFYEALTDSGFYSGDAFAAVNNLSAEQEISFSNVPDGLFIVLNNAEIVL